MTTKFLVAITIGFANFFAESNACAQLYFTTAPNAVTKSTFNGNTITPSYAQFTSDIWDMALDSNTNKLYWYEDGAIVRAPRSGSGPVETVVQTSTPVGRIVVDPDNNKVYWTEPANDRIMRCTRSGTSITVLYNAFAGLDDPFAIAVDAANGWLYCSDNEGIKRGPLGGGGSLDSAAGTSGSILSIALNVADDHMYWSENSLIYRSGLDGSNAVLWHTNSFDHVSNIALNIPQEKVYWSDTDGIKVKAMSGGAVSTVLYEGDITGLVARPN